MRSTRWAPAGVRGLLVVGALLFSVGCAATESELVAGGAGPAGDQATPAPVAPQSLPQDAGPDCVGRPPAPALAPEDLIGHWTWSRGMLVDSSGEYDTMVRGDLDLQPGGRWDGEREITNLGSMGPQSVDTYTTLAYGPGSWSFDGYNLTLTYDDGSDPDTYNTVRVGVHQDAGATLRDMTLEIVYEDGSCLVYVLSGEQQAGGAP